jgi:hypothetical protein
VKKIVHHKKFLPPLHFHVNGSFDDSPVLLEFKKPKSPRISDYSKAEIHLQLGFSLVIYPKSSQNSIRPYSLIVIGYTL